MTLDPDRLRARLRADLTNAMKARDKIAVAALRIALAAFDNAEAVPAPPIGRAPSTSEYVAGTSVGLGSAEVARRELTLEDLYAVLRAQIDERVAEANAYAAHGHAEAGDRLRREADVLRAYLV